MPKNQIDIWLKALRSGKFSQTQMILHDVDSGGYCCLGVFAKVYLPNKFGEDDYTSCGLSKFINELIYDESEDHCLIATDLFDVLTCMNDNAEINLSDEDVMNLPEIKEHNKLFYSEPFGKGRDFNFIADFIEKYVEVI